MNYIEVNEVKAYIGAEFNEHDSVLESLIARMQAIMESEKCNRVFGSSLFTEYIDGDGSDTLILKNYPINQVMSVHDDLDREYKAEDEIDLDDIANYPEHGILKFVNGTFSIGIRNIKVVYNAGYARLPDDLRQALIQLVASEYLLSRAQLNAIRSSGDENTQDDKPARMRQEAEKVFKAYRKFAT